MRRMVLTFLIVFTAVLVAAGIHAVATSSAGAVAPPEVPAGWTPSPSTLVAVTGDPANGFRIDRYGGRTDFTTTWSEARAECGEYARMLDRVRCRVSARTRYRTLAATVEALRYQQWRQRG